MWNLAPQPKRIGLSGPGVTWRSRTVIATACTMLRAPSFARTDVRCDFTVSGLFERSIADWRVVRPLAASSSTSSSLRERSAVTPRGGALRAACSQTSRCGSSSGDRAASVACVEVVGAGIVPSRVAVQMVACSRAGHTGPRRLPAVRSVSAGPPRIRTILGDARVEPRVALASSWCEHVFAMESPTILHADLDAFFAAVEQRDDPGLRGRPVIVGSWVVLAASYEAKRRGVRTAMSVARALRLCPAAVVVEPRMAAYSQASKDVYDVFEDTSPRVEGLSIDEAFLDVRGVRRLTGPPPAVAELLRREVRERVGLPITVGVARTKFLAKVASGVAKPDGLLVVPPERELAFLHPLEVERLWGVGPVTARRLHGVGITTVGQVAELDEGVLVSLLGRAAGRQLYALARNHDPRQVRARRRRGSIGAQHALGRSPRSPEAVEASLAGLVDRVGRRMRVAGRTGRTVVLRLRFDDFTRATRSHTLPYPTASTRTILEAARALLALARPLIAERGITLVGVAVTTLADGRSFQPMLPFERDTDALDAALDEVRLRFGSAAVTRAVLLGRNPAPVPLLSD